MPTASDRNTRSHEDQSREQVTANRMGNKVSATFHTVQSATAHDRDQRAARLAASAVLETTKRKAGDHNKERWRAMPGAMIFTKEAGTGALQRSVNKRYNSHSGSQKRQAPPGRHGLGKDNQLCCPPQRETGTRKLLPYALSSERPLRIVLRPRR